MGNAGKQGKGRIFPNAVGVASAAVETEAQFLIAATDGRAPFIIGTVIERQAGPQGGGLAASRFQTELVGYLPVDDQNGDDRRAFFEL